VLKTWSSFPTSIKHGNNYDFGNFDQCLSVNFETSDGETIDGQHCMIQFYSKLNDTIPQTPVKSSLNSGWRNIDTRFGAGICLPSSCSPEIIESLMMNVFKDSDYVYADDYDQADYCKISSSRQENSNSLFILVCAGAVLMTLMTMSTIYDISSQHLKKEKRSELWSSFSLYSNVSSLINMTRSSTSGHIDCLDGFRAIVAVFVVLGHSVANRIRYPVKDPQQISILVGTSNEYNFNGLSAFVDLFFLMSALLVTISIFKDLDA